MTPDLFHYDSFEYFFDLFAFCLLLVPCYYLTASESLRRALLTLSGMYLVYFIAPRLLLFYLAFWTIIYLLHCLISRARNMSGPIFFFLILAVLLPMLAWKLNETTFNALFNVHISSLLSYISVKLWEIDLIRDPLTPIGLSFATFRGIDLLVKTWITKVRRLSFERVMFYGFFPPVQITGPILEYEEIAQQNTEPDPQVILQGALRICVGVLKVFFIAAALKKTQDIFAAPHDMPLPELWTKFVGYSWYFYINFSGYSDMAIGTARLFGFRLKENFNFPYFKPNIQEFWNSWHISLSRFAQRNVFVPAGGYRPHTQYLALFLTIMTIALWHGCTLSMVAFGTYHFAGLAAYRLYSARMKKAGNQLSSDTTLPTLGTYVFVLMSFPLISLPLGKAVVFYQALVGM